MTGRLAQSWGREPIGYRRGELSGADGVAVSSVVLIGGPAFLVGARFVGELGLGLVQILLVAPLAALLGGMVVGASARMAATTGAHATWLQRPPFGSAGSRFVSSVRLAVVVLWAIVGLQLVGGWVTAAAETAGLDGGTWASPAAIGIVALLAVGMLGWGLSNSIRSIVRRPLFWASVALLGLVAWRLAMIDQVSTGDADGFWLGVQEATEMTVVLVPFVQTVARRLRDDDEAQASFGVGYAVPATLVFITGALFGGLVGGIPADLSALVTGSVGGLLAIAWVVVAEVDQALAAFASGGAEASGIATRVPESLGGYVVVLLIAGIAAFGPTVDLGLASLLAAIAFPAALISIVDFYVAHRQYYSQSDLFGAVGEGRLVNVVGVSSWVVVVALGQVVDPVGPGAWMSAIPAVGFAEGLPWRLLMALLGAAAYLVLLRWQEGRTGRVHELRGVDRQVTNEM